MKALIIDHVSDYIGNTISEYGVEVDYKMLPTKDELKEVIGAYELLIMRIDPFIDKEILEAAKQLKAICVCSVGVNHIDLDFAKEKGIRVTNAPGVNSNAVAELTLSKILDLFRNTMAAHEEIKYERNWNKYKWVGWELKGKTIGIVGFGKIGSRVARLAQGFEMKTVAYDPYLKKEDIEAQGTKYAATLRELLESSECISLHVPIKDDTRNMISREQFDQMKPGAYLVNCARGGVVDEEAAYDNLKSGKLGGFSTDVLLAELSGDGFSKEDIPLTSPLFEFKNFHCSPHFGGGTHDALNAIGELVVEKIIKIFALKK